MRQVLMWVLGTTFVAVPTSLNGQSVYGRWDLTVHDGAREWPAWLEVVEGSPVSGRLQGRVGHALDLTGIEVAGGRLGFTLPAAWGPLGGRPFEATVSGDRLVARILAEGRELRVEGARAPALDRPDPVAWGEPVDLLAEGLTGWSTRDPARDGWALHDGELSNTMPSSDLITRRKFSDFRLRLEVKVPEGGNSGIYLRGRHEVQVQDDHGNEPHNRRMGGIYGQLTPSALPTRPAGEWQTFEVTLVGRRVTVVLNGVTIIDRQEIPGITGGALDSREGEPGPIMLQGDHTAVVYRRIVIQEARR